jgi:Zn-dependent protease/predicted transcriptional regulator
MMPGTVRLGRIGDVDIRINVSLIFIFALISWSLAAYYFPLHHPGVGPTTAWLLALLSGLLLFGSILVHELGHAFVARRRGLGVNSITLFVFGGVASLAGEPRRPRDELEIAAAGPATSLMLASGCYLAAWVVQGPSAEAAAVLGYLATANLVLGLFNLAPGFPLDGGRVLRAVVWHATGSAARATQVAATAGRAVAYVVMAGGVLQAFNGNSLGGLWIALVGWFMLNAAKNSSVQASLEERIAGLTVQDVMHPDPVTVSVHLSLQRLIDEYLLRQSASTLPVMNDGHLVGTISLQEVLSTRPEAWRDTEVGDVMTRKDTAGLVAADETLLAALQRLGRGGRDWLLVVSDGRPVGILSRAGVVRYLEVQAVRQRGAYLPMVATARGERPGWTERREARKVAGRW